MLKSMKKNEVGFSLLELIVTMVIITTVSMGLMATHFYAKKQQLVIKERVIIMAVLEKEMNSLRVTGAKNLALGTVNRTTTLDQDGVVGTVTTEVMAGTTDKDRFARVRLDWNVIDGQPSKHESITGFLFSE